MPTLDQLLEFFPKEDDIQFRPVMKQSDLGSKLVEVRDGHHKGIAHGHVGPLMKDRKSFLDKRKVKRRGV